jgi:hypothetical protein
MPAPELPNKAANGFAPESLAAEAAAAAGAAVSAAPEASLPDLNREPNKGGFGMGAKELPPAPEAGPLLFCWLLLVTVIGALLALMEKEGAAVEDAG